MTGFEIHRVPFAREPLATWAQKDSRRTNWPVVYTIDGPRHVYVGETTQAQSRIRQHLAVRSTTDFADVRVVLDDTFNKSVCLDLESYLIRLFAGDGQYVVANGNVGLTESDYYQRTEYRERFEAIFESLREDGLFTRSTVEIENTDLFKLSPFKALSQDQREAVLSIVESLLADLGSRQGSLSVVHGGPGTGKTVVAIYLMKLLADIGAERQSAEPDAVLSGLFTSANARRLDGFRTGLVVPQQSLRTTVKNVFRKTPGLRPDMVLSPFDIAQSERTFDLLVVDEAHRLQQLSATLPTLITKFKQINSRLFGDERAGDQLDWVRASSRTSLLMLDTDQTVRPADIPASRLSEVQAGAAGQGRMFALHSQMRVRAGEDYTGYVRSILTGSKPEPRRFAEYELTLFEDLTRMRQILREKEATHGLARLVAGYAWKWRSKSDPARHDIEIGGERLFWNRRATDWISSPTSAEEVGSIHTVQGYDLNYAGVIIGPDLRHDPERGLYIDRDSYFDVKGKANNKMLGITYSDADLQRYITNIYAVLLTRAIRGTFVYVCDPGLRAYLARFLPAPADDLSFDASWPTTRQEFDRADRSDRDKTTPARFDLGRPEV